MKAKKANKKLAYRANCSIPTLLHIALSVLKYIIDHILHIFLLLLFKSLVQNKNSCSLLGSKKAKSLDIAVTVLQYTLKGIQGKKTNKTRYGNLCFGKIGPHRVMYIFQETFK